MAKRSGASLAILLGEISPKSSTRAVITTVDIVTPFLPKYEVKITVDNEAEAIFTTLFPIRMVESSLS